MSNGGRRLALWPLRVAAGVIACAALSSCSSAGFHPSHGTGAADLGATQGFGLGASNEGSLVNQASPGPGVVEFGGGN